jgi:hypothetical protein
MNLKELIKQITRDVLNENEFNSISTMEKLIKQAEKDGHVFGDYGQYIIDAAKKVANKFDQLPTEEQKVMRDTYYKAFLKMIGKVNEDTGTGAIGVGAGPIATPNWVAPKGQKKNAATKTTIEQGFKIANNKKKKKVKIHQESWYTQSSKRGEASGYTASSPSSRPSLYLQKSEYTSENMNESLINIIKEELLNEVTYHKFKNEVKFRTKNEQLHKAIREVKRKLSEIDRIVEYTSRMKQELSEGEEGIKYWRVTEKYVGQIAETINQLSNKIKNLQQ